jgi:hypothetical protein
MKSMSMVDQVAVHLGVQVQERLAQRVQATDPHLRRREGVHPDDDADAVVVRRGVQHRAPDLVGGEDDGLPDQLDGGLQPVGELPDHLPRLLGDLIERLGPVQRLAAGHEPHGLARRLCLGHVGS